MPEPPALASTLHTTLICWYTRHARRLPWREATRTPWGVLVSEVMLQQTPVARVLPAWQHWMDRWPSPPSLAAAPTADVLRAWDRLGYPRRALWLKRAASQITTAHNGVVPAEISQLEALPGVGTYTAAAVASFAYGRRALVLDTNIRRVFARILEGAARAPATPSAAERSLAQQFLPHEPARAANWNIAVMEFGSLVCTSRNPQCPSCPVRQYCRWYTVGKPEPSNRTRTQKWAGTDRQLRGALMAVLRASTEPVPLEILRTAALPAQDLPMPDLSAPVLDALKHLAALQPELERTEKIVAGLIADNLAEERPLGLSLPR